MVKGLRKENALGLKIKATTFHKLGYDYIKHFQKNPPAVANENLLYQTIKQFLKNDILHHDSALKSFVQFMACYLNIPEENDAFDSLGEKLDIKNGIDFETLKSKYYANTSGSQRISKNKLDTFSGERVKSVEELMIANFLFLKGVNYEYEKTYPHGDHMYRPDFYLTDYDIWLEHFGIDKHGRAKWLSEFQEKQYLKSIHKKHAKHRLYRTKLLETGTLGGILLRGPHHEPVHRLFETETQPDFVPPRSIAMRPSPPRI